MPRYALDTNLYIDALRVESERTAIGAFQSRVAPFLHMSAVVAMELAAGARSAANAVALEKALVAPFERRGRIFAPSRAAWGDAGRVLAAIVGRGAWESISRSLVNDVLLAMSCREEGITLVTRNVKDCERIARVRRFAFAAAWPLSS